MIITESRLRKLIRAVILEEENLEEGWKENFTAGLLSLAFALPVNAKPLSYTNASSLSVELVEDSIGFDQRINRIVTKAIKSVDKSKVDELTSKVIDPWLNGAVKKAMSNKDNLDHGGRLHYEFIKQLELILAEKLDAFKKETKQSKSSNSISSKRFIDSTQSSLTSSERNKYKESQEKLRKALNR